MQSASIPQTLIDVRPVVRNMRPDGYVLQTGGSATRKVIEMEAALPRDGRPAAHAQRERDDQRDGGLHQNADD